MSKVSEELVKNIAFRIDTELVNEFRSVVKESGYSQTFLIQKAMKNIIKELNDAKYHC